MIADEAVLHQHGVDEIPSGIVYKGWAFKTNKTSIADETKVLALAKLLSIEANGDESELRGDDRIMVNGSLLHLPGMIHANNHVHMYRLEEGGAKIALIAEDALKRWALRHNDSPRPEQLKVPFAWKQSDVAGVITPEEPSDTTHKWDWTFSDSDYCCSLLRIDSLTADITARDVVGARLISQQTKGSVFACANGDIPIGKTGRQWEARQSSGINMALLQERDDILFYDDVVLFQDDLEDCGETTLSVKVRVMPKCWFTLMRTYMRIDNGTIRVRDVRMFHAFKGASGNKLNSNPYFNEAVVGADSSNSSGEGEVASGSEEEIEYVHMDITWHEGSYKQIEASLGGKIDPAQVRSDPNAVLKHVPLVNQKESVHKSFRLRLN